MDFSIPKVKNNRFKSKFGGYSYQEVDEYVADILGELEVLKVTNRELKRQAAVFNQQQALLAVMREEIVDLIVNSQNYSNKIKKRALMQAKVTVKFATQEADRISSDANETAKQTIVDKVEEVKLHAASLDKLKAIVAIYQNQLLQAFDKQEELVLAFDKPKVIQPTEPVLVEVIMPTQIDTVEEKVISLEVEDRQIDLGIIAEDTVDYPVMVHTLDSTTNKKAIKIQEITTDTNDKGELIINLSLTVSK